MGSTTQGGAGKGFQEAGNVDSGTPHGGEIPISIRLGSEQIAAAKKIAAAKSVGYQTQLRMWIAEGIKREAKRA